jgi:hypothetical protein
MKASNHNIICVSLTLDLFNKHIVEEKGSPFTTHLVSPAGNLFLIGDTDLIEEIEHDENHIEIELYDAGDTKRHIMFHHGESDYSILLNEFGTPSNSTGITPVDDDEDFNNFVKFETGLVGQEVCESEEE